MTTDLFNLDEFPRLVTCRSGDPYWFTQRNIQFIRNYRPFPFTGNTIYIFIKDPLSSQPTLIDIDFSSNWSIPYKEIDHYEFIQKHEPTHILYLQNFEKGYEHPTIHDILGGNDFDSTHCYQFGVD